MQKNNGESLKINWLSRSVSVDALIPFELNPRKISPKELTNLKNSIAEDGYHQRIIATQDLRVIGGHQRITVLKELGIDTVEILVPDREISDEQFKRILVRDNLSFGEWELEPLGDLMPMAELAELGLPEANVAKIGRQSSAGLTDDDEAPEPPEAPTSRPQDIWLCGGHRVMCGSAIVSDDVKALMDGGLADMLLTDPPYNVAYEGKTKDALTIQNDSMKDGEFHAFLLDAFLLDAFLLANSVMREGAVFYIWHADSEGYNFRGAAQKAGLRIRQCVIWLKNTIVMGRQDYHWKHEPCLYGWKEGAAHYWGNDRKQSTIIECNKPQRNGEHPTMKPVELMEYQIGNSSRTNDIVLDLFGGSGSTMIACEKIGRCARILELDPKYVDVIVKRWQDFSGQQARLESTGETFAERSAA